MRLTVAGDAKSIFGNALELDAAARREYLEEACSGEPRLRSEIERLLGPRTRGHMVDSQRIRVGRAHGVQKCNRRSRLRGEPTDRGRHDASTLLDSSDKPGLLGSLGHYEVHGVLGSGGFGTVFKAQDTTLNRWVAVKLLAPQLLANHDARQRFVREARAAAAVRDEHVVGIHAVHEGDPAPYLVMEFIAGGTLADRLVNGQPLETREVLRIGAETALGLAAAHACGLIHRDVKPANILLELDTGRVRLTDFGLARSNADDVRVTVDGTLIGTPAYMSPEQARGLPIDARADLYSLGVVLYQMAAGAMPYRGKDIFSILAALALDTPVCPAEKNPLVPPDLSRLILRLLAKNPLDRPDSAHGVAEELRRIAAALDETASKSRMEALPAAQAKSVRQSRHRWMKAAIAGALAAGMALAAWQVIQIKTRKGTLEIETDDPNIEVVVRKDGAVIRDGNDKNGGREYALTVGDGKINLTEPKGGLKLSTDKFEIDHDGKPSVKAQLIKPQAVDPARAALEWVIASGGWIDLFVDGKARTLKPGDRIPTGSLAVIRLSLEHVKTLDDSLGEKLRALPDVAETLILEWSSLTDAGLAGIARCPGLVKVKTLDLAGTAVTGAGLKHMAAFPNLTKLLLEQCADIEDDGMEAIAATKVVRLTIDRTKVTDAGIKKLRLMKKLKLLKVSGPGITDASVETLRGFTLLEYLALDGSRVSDAGAVRVLEALVHLESVSFSSTDASDAVAASIAKCRTLRTVMLENTAITDVGLKHLSKCRALSTLVVNGTGVTKDGIERFIKDRPGCMLVYTGGMYDPRK